MIDWKSIQQQSIQKIDWAADLKSAKNLIKLCQLLKESIPHYQWVGIYVMQSEKKKLKLLCYSGLPTEHIEIDYGKGICGQVAMSGEPFIVDDVREQSNYISCNVDVQSEIVYPIYSGDELVAQIDIDSNQLSPFGDEDSLLLSEISGQLGKYWKVCFSL
jgi:GAF domain-containing protein